MSSLPNEGRNRVIIEAVTPTVDAGRFPAKRTAGDLVRIEADIFTDGHDSIACSVLVHREESGPESDRWLEVPMTPLVNDRWTASFRVGEVGRYGFKVQGWVDHFETWRLALLKRIKADSDAAVDYLIGADLIDQAAARATGADHAWLLDRAQVLRGVAAVPRPSALGPRPSSSSPAPTALGAQPSPSSPSALDPRPSTLRTHATDPMLHEIARRYPDKRFVSESDEYILVVDPVRARFSAWYEFFPRSTAAEPGRHGTFADCEARLPYVSEMGFDVVYLPPIHPIGRTFRKGPNNNPESKPGDEGSPWAIGSADGGHKSIHASLGAAADFRRFVEKARGLDISIALDIAFQAAPDHPYVAEHPNWFKQRPDGTIQYAENPPKKYQDIYPFDFESEDWPGMWAELKSVFDFWIDHGVTIFRVDNPHTKAFPFWEWVIGALKRDHPEVLFLAEAFTRPKIMYRLAKLGFSQSYTYFPWRNAKWELTQYLTELTQTPVREFFRPNQWPNTPDILTEFLQIGGRQVFAIRYLLAATLGANYGIYGPAFELMEHVPVRRGSEEYLDSEKYQIRHWDLGEPVSGKAESDRAGSAQTGTTGSGTTGSGTTSAGATSGGTTGSGATSAGTTGTGSDRTGAGATGSAHPDSLAPLIARVNRIRRENEALQSDWSLRFHPIENDQIVAFTKESPDRSNLILAVVNLDPHYTQSGFITLPLDELEIPADRGFEAEDLLTGERYLWHGPRNYVELNPALRAAHILKIHRRLKVETDFEYFL